MDVAVEAFAFGLIAAGVIALASVGFSMQFASTGILNLAYGEIMTLALFVGYLAATAGAGFIATIAIGGITGGTLSLVLMRLVFLPFARRGTKVWGTVAVTVAVAIIIQNVLQIPTKGTYYTFPFRPSGVVHVLGLSFTDMELTIVVIASCLIVAVHMWLKTARMGKAIRATSVNPELARSCGIPTRRVIDATWVVSGTLCGVGGVTLGGVLVTFKFTSGAEFLILFFAAAVLGGLGHPMGAVLGSILIGVTSELVAIALDGSYRLLFSFVVLGVVLLLRPQGIMSDIAERKNVLA